MGTGISDMGCGKRATEIAEDKEDIKDLRDLKDAKDVKDAEGFGGSTLMMRGVIVLHNSCAVGWRVMFGGNFLEEGLRPVPL